MKRVLLEHAYVLHRRSYRETSFLVDFFCLEHGRVTLLARGVKKRASSLPGILQPFIPLVVSWGGKGELMTLTHVEAHGDPTSLQGECLFAGLYLNELLTCLLEKGDAHPALFHAYTNALLDMRQGLLHQKTLRRFEKVLLEEIGYGPLPKIDSSLHNRFDSEQWYRFVPEHGFELSTMRGVSPASGNVFSGKSILAMAMEQWDDPVTLQEAKRLTRLVLAPLLGNRPIYSRQLFIQPEDVNE